MISEAFGAVGSRRVILIGGKGGVGKTTISIAAALHFAKSRETILFTTDPASNLADFFSENRQQTTDNLKIEALHAEQLYAKFLEANLASFLELGDRGTYLDKEELRRLFELALPGVDELMAWMRAGEIAEEHPQAVVIIDTAPTGHTLRMLGAADHFKQLAETLDSLQAKHRDLVRQLTRRNVRDALDQFIDDFDARVRRRRETLTDARQSGFIPVMLSEPWVVEQTRRLIAEVRSGGIDVPLAILNRAAADCDCARCKQQRDRDALARETVGIKVVDAQRSCVPLDSPERIGSWSA